MRHIKQVLNAVTEWLFFYSVRKWKFRWTQKKKRKAIWLDWCKGGEGTMLFNLFFFISLSYSFFAVTQHGIDKLHSTPFTLSRWKTKHHKNKSLQFRLWLTYLLPSNLLHLLIHFLWQFFMTFQQFTLYSVSIIFSL